MSTEPKNILLLMMGGVGNRFGADIPKQFIEIKGRPIFSYIVEKYDETNYIDALIVVCHASWISFAEEWIEKMGITSPCKVVAGGSTRSESVKNGLSASLDFASENDVILIHDATHPYVDEENLPKIIAATKRCGGATLGQCQYDTVYGFSPSTNLLERVIPRETVVSGASPEAFLFGRVFDIYQNTPLSDLEKYTSAGALALAHDIKMEVVPTGLINLKITYKPDMEVFKKLIDGYYF